MKRFLLAIVLMTITIAVHANEAQFCQAFGQVAGQAAIDAHRGVPVLKSVHRRVDNWKCSLDVCDARRDAMATAVRVIYSERDWPHSSLNGGAVTRVKARAERSCLQAMVLR